MLLKKIDRAITTRMKHARSQARNKRRYLDKRINHNFGENFGEFNSLVFSLGYTRLLTIDDRGLECSQPTTRFNRCSSHLPLRFHKMPL